MNFDVGNIVEQIELIKNNLSNLKEELENIKVRGTDENNIITAVISGSGKILDYEFDIVKINFNNPIKIKQAIIEASNRGLEKSYKLAAEKKKGIVDKINIPDIPGLF
jgi:nucleoid-associated protein EbfC